MTVAGTTAITEFWAKCKTFFAPQSHTHFDEIYPVGSIYMSVNSTDPSTLFGGTWERITGSFLLAATDNGSSGASQAAGNTGGAATVTLTAAQSGVPAHAHGLNSHTHGMGHRHTTPKLTHSVTYTNPSVKYSKPKAHTHGLTSAQALVGVSGNYFYYYYVGTDSSWKSNYYMGGSSHGSYAETMATGAKLVGKTDSTSGFDTNQVATVSGGSVVVDDHAAGYTGNSINTGSTAARTSTDGCSTNTANSSAANASSAHNNMPPYLSVYVWKRTA